MLMAWLQRTHRVRKANRPPAATRAQRAGSEDIARADASATNNLERVKGIGRYHNWMKASV